MDVTPVGLLLFGVWVALALSMGLAVYWRGRPGSTSRPVLPFRTSEPSGLVGAGVHAPFKFERCPSCDRIVPEGAHTVHLIERDRPVLRYTCRRMFGIDRRSRRRDRRMGTSDRRFYLSPVWSLDHDRRAVPSDRRRGPRDRRHVAA